MENNNVVVERGVFGECMCLNKKGDLRLPINVILMYIYKHQGQHYTSTERTFI